MTDDDKNLLIQTSEDVKQLKKLAQELLYALNGGIGTQGLISRIENAEHKREMQVERDQELKEALIRDNDNFKNFVLQQLGGVEDSIHRKFQSLDKEIDYRFQEISKFKKELSEFKTRLEIYMGLLTGKSTWMFLFKAAAFLISAGGIFYALWKGGYDLIIKFVKGLA